MLSIRHIVCFFYTISVRTRRTRFEAKEEEEEQWNKIFSQCTHIILCGSGFSTRFHCVCVCVSCELEVVCVCMFVTPTIFYCIIGVCFFMRMCVKEIKLMFLVKLTLEPCNKINWGYTTQQQQQHQQQQQKYTQNLLSFFLILFCFCFLLYALIFFYSSAASVPCFFFLHLL